MLPQESKNQNDSLTAETAQAIDIKLFNQLFEADKNRLYAYIFAFVSNQTIADDVFQETCLTLWKEFGKFERGTNFSKWANTIAFNRVLTYRNTHKKYQLGLDDDFIKEFSETVAVVESRNTNHDSKWCHLEQCSSALSSSLKMVYQRFYVENQTAQNIADNTGRSIYAIRKAVRKLRKRLIDCVDTKSAEANDES